MRIRCRNFYYILGVRQNAKLADIKSAYRQQCKVNHPDKMPKLRFTVGNMIMCDLNQIWQVLKDEAVARPCYDAWLEWILMGQELKIFPPRTRVDIYREAIVGPDDNVIPYPEGNYGHGAWVIV